MGKIIIIVSMLFCTVSANAQEDYIRGGLIRSSLTFSPSFMLNRDEMNYYLSGHLEGYLDKKVSFRGETHFNTGSSKENPYFNLASRTYFGVLYHVNKNNLDGHVGFMPGWSIMQIDGDLNASGRNPVHFVPSFSVNMGINYYAWKFVNFFANVTYVYSDVSRLENINGRTDELMISAGLGFNINAVKAK